MNEREERNRQERIRRRAYELWEAEGRPEGREEAHWDQASELIAIEDNQGLTTQPRPGAVSIGPEGEPTEPIESVENTGEFPTLTDQGEQTFPARETEEALAGERPLEEEPSKRRD